MIYCKSCQNHKHNTEFTISELKKTYPRCKSCVSAVGKEYRYKNKGKLKLSGQLWRQENKEKINLRKKQYRENNKPKIKEYTKQYYKNNKIRMKNYNIEYKKQRKLIDPCFKLNSEISKTISKALRRQNSSKKNKSCLKYLPYTIQDLKRHLEAQFEPWMTWENWGVYKIEDYLHETTTWKWQIDHIVPQSDLPYSFMEDDNFKRCWSLENLRPLRADINHYDGVNRKRHII